MTASSTLPTLTRLAEIAERDAVAAPLALLHLSVGGEAAGTAWEGSVPALEAERLADGLPLLYRLTLEVQPRRVRALLEALVEAARLSGTTQVDEIGAAVARGTLDPLALLEASMCQDTGRLAELAELAGGVELELLAVVGQLLAVPLLRVCGRKAQPLLAERTWDSGYCPVCAAWPTLAERRGLERRRYLRCGRCAAEWTYALQRCPYCGNGDHKALGYLAPEAQRESQQAATCDVCHGYLKSLTTVNALSPEELVARDLTTLELDVAAMEHGYARPDERGFALEVEVIGGHG